LKKNRSSVNVKNAVAHAGELSVMFASSLKSLRKCNPRKRFQKAWKRNRSLHALTQKIC